MRKLVFSVVAIAMLASCALFAQEESGVKRTINGIWLQTVVIFLMTKKMVLVILFGLVMNLK